MVSRLAQLVGVAPHAVADVYLQGPAGIHVLLTDQVVCNLKDEAMFSVEILQGKYPNILRNLCISIRVQIVISKPQCCE